MQRLEAASRKEAAPFLSQAPSLVVSHHGELKKLLADLDRKAPSATRVVLAHAYHRLDPDLLWDLAADDLPRVAQALGPIDTADDGPAETENSG